MQKDELCPHLSVIEAMELAASLKLGDTLSSHIKNALVIRVHTYIAYTLFMTFITCYIRLMKSLIPSVLATQERPLLLTCPVEKERGYPSPLK